MINIAYIGSWKHFVSVFVCVCVSLSLYLSFCNSSSQSLSSPDDELSENIWFVWSRTSYSGDKWRCHHADGRTDKQTNKQVKIELLSLWTVWDWVSQYKRTFTCYWWSKRSYYEDTQFNLVLLVYLVLSKIWCVSNVFFFININKVLNK